MQLVPKLACQDLTLTRAQKVVLQSVSLQIPTGKITVLTGRSGSGKSTLLRCFNRLLEPPPHTVFLDKSDIKSIDVLVLRRRIGLLMQTPIMFAGSVYDNVCYAPALRGVRLGNQAVGELLTLAGVEEALWQQSAETLSGGQAQRVALARVLANEPDVLLLDEPTSALDPESTDIIEQSVRQLCTQTGLTVIWVSHLPAQAARLADQTITLEAGRVAMQETLQNE